MAVTSRQRRVLHARLAETLGADVADTLMDYLPPHGWSDVARQNDLDLLGARLDAKLSSVREEISAVRSEMAEMRGELRSEITEVRGQLRSEMADLRGELRGEIAGLRGELRGEIGGLRGEIGQRFAAQTRWFLGSQLVLVAAVIGSITAIAH